MKLSFADLGASYVNVGAVASVGGAIGGDFVAVNAGNCSRNSADVSLSLATSVVLGKVASGIQVKSCAIVGRSDFAIAIDQDVLVCTTDGDGCSLEFAG
ncbi:hypothetical protein D3C71_1995790 [compost metagenome]